MTAQSLYQQAYTAHYSEFDCDKALDGYRRVISEFPNSAEAGYARTQITNLERDRTALERKRSPASVPVAPHVALTTASILEGFRVVETIDVISAECVFGMNIFRDFFASVTDVFGGRSRATQKVLRDARKRCLDELRYEAREVGANAVIAVDLDYSEFSGHGKSMLFLVASGTAVRVEPNPPPHGHWSPPPVTGPV